MNIVVPGKNLKFLGSMYSVGPGQKIAARSGVCGKPTPAGAGHRPESGNFHLFALHYLLGAKAVEIAGHWISEKEVPGGATFFRGPHRIPTDRVSNRFENDLHGFRKRCEQLAGEPVRMADAAYTFAITRRIPVAALYWCEDDDFPAECELLYDETIRKHLAADIIYSLGVGICRTLQEA
jgi:hypothetical protein